MLQDHTWTPQPLPLYDTAGDIVLPPEYETALAGSLTCIKFSLTRHWESQTNCYHYRANVEEIHLIRKTQVSIGCSAHEKLVQSVRNTDPVHT